jgi:hypothetical protein
MFWTFVSSLPRHDRMGGMNELLNACDSVYTCRGRPIPYWMQRNRERALREEMVNIGRLEPDRTIYGPQWIAAVEAVAYAPLEDQPPLRAILNELEAGWARVRRILELAKHEPDRIDQPDAVGLFAIDVGEIFRAAVLDCAVWLKAYADALHGGPQVPDQENILSDIARFTTHAAILGIAANTSGVDPRLDGAAQTLSREARAWADTVERLIRAVPEMELVEVDG